MTQHTKTTSLILTEFLKELGDSLISLVLFGSTARREDYADSDYDLLVVVKNEKYEKLEKQCDIISTALTQKLGRPVNPVIVTLNDLKFITESRFPLILGVLSACRILYDRNKTFSETTSEIFRALKEGDLRFYKRSGIWMVNVDRS